MMSASLALQQMLVSALAGIEGVAVYDGPPPDAVSPYLVVGADLVTDWSTKTEIGHEHRISVSVWDRGPGAAGAKTLSGHVEAALNSLSGIQDGHAVVSVRLVRTLTLTDPEGWTQGVVEYRVRTRAI